MHLPPRIQYHIFLICTLLYSTNCSFIFYTLQSNNDVAMLEDILNTRTDEIPMCFRKSIKTLKKLRKYVVNSLKYDYTNAMVEGKNNKIKVIKRVSYGYRSFRNFKARIMLMERYKIQKGNIHSYKFAMDAAA